MSQADLLWMLIGIGSTIANAISIILRIKNSGKTTISPNPLEVRACIDYATRAELEKTNRRLEKVEGKIGSEINGVYESVNGLRKELSKITNEIMRALGRIEGSQKL